MSINTLAATLCVAMALLVGVAAVITHWDAIEKENNAFAKDCNDRGGIVIFGASARQCLGDRPTKESK